MSNWHKNEIPKGTFGEFSKIKEEFLELEDSIQQNQPLMALFECSDLVGAIEGFVAKYNLSLDDLKKFNRLRNSVLLKENEIQNK